MLQTEWNTAAAIACDELRSRWTRVTVAGFSSILKSMTDEAGFRAANAIYQASSSRYDHVWTKYGQRHLVLARFVLTDAHGLKLYARLRSLYAREAMRWHLRNIESAARVSWGDALTRLVPL